MMSKRIVAVALAVALMAGAILSGCSSGKTSLDIRGSDTMINLGAAWAEAFMKANKNYTVAVQGGGSGTGIKALINKNCDIAQASRPMKKDEIDAAKKNGVEPKEFIVAYDGVAMIVNPSNPVNELTSEQLAKIFRGEITNWKEVGGKDEPIVVLARDTASGTHVFIKEHVVQERETKKGAEYGKNVQFLTSNQAIATEVSQNPKAIGYVGLGYLGGKVKAVKIKKDASSPAVAPSAATVKDKTYDLSRPLFMYTNGEPKGLVKQYLDFVLGTAGQQIVSKLDFVPVK